MCKEYKAFVFMNTSKEYKLQAQILVTVLANNIDDAVRYINNYFPTCTIHSIMDRSIYSGEFANIFFQSPDTNQ